jgi:hypothetical protein
MTTETELHRRQAPRPFPSIASQRAKPSNSPGPEYELLAAPSPASPGDTVWLTILNRGDRVLETGLENNVEVYRDGRWEDANEAVYGRPEPEVRALGIIVPPGRGHRSRLQRLDHRCRAPAGRPARWALSDQQARLPEYRGQFSPAIRGVFEVEGSRAPVASPSTRGQAGAFECVLERTVTSASRPTRRSEPGRRRPLRHSKRAARRSTRWLGGSRGDVGGEVALQLVGVGATDGRLVFVKPLAERDPSERGVV